MPSTILIVGAGFSGTVLAANLLRRAHSTPTTVILAERSDAMGRGVAYAVREFPFLLNVPAARLSADSKDPLQFLRFARRRLPEADGEDFLPRSLYGDYLQDLLSQAEKAAPSHVRLARVFGEVTDILTNESAAPLVARFADGTSRNADIVILALGNPPAPLLPWAQQLRNHPGFRQDPWDLPKNLGAEHSVLIVGS